MGDIPVGFLGVSIGGIVGFLRVSMGGIAGFLGVSIGGIVGFLGLEFQNNSCSQNMCDEKKKQ